jgi:hypothetical protein
VARGTGSAAAGALAWRAALAAMGMLLALLAGPTAHHNYQLWWLPLLAALLGAALPAKSSVAPELKEV